MAVVGERMAPNVRRHNYRVYAYQVNEKYILDASDEMGAIWKLEMAAAVALAYIPAVVEYAGQVSLINAMKPVRRAVNERAANSLFMRDMEFVR